MSIPLDEILTDFSGDISASEQVVAGAEREIGKRLPVDFRAFLLRYNGGEGSIGKHYLIVWKAEELAKFNREYEVHDYAPGLIAFGSNGGGECFAFDTRETHFPVVQVAFIGMCLNDAVRVADSFEKLLEKMVRSNGSLL